MDLKEKQVLVTLYRKSFLDSATASKDMEVVSSQMLYIMKDKNGNSNTQKADSVWASLQNIKSDSEINAFFTKETDEQGRKPVAGLVEPQCMNCSKENILKDIFSEAHEKNITGQFFKKEINKDIFIYRILEIKKIKKDDFGAYVKKKYKDIISKAKEYATKATEEEKKLAEYYLRDEVQIGKETDMIVQRNTNDFENNLWLDQFKRIIVESKFEFSKELQDLFDGKLTAIPDFKDTSVLYTDAGKDFMYKDLRAEYNKINLKKKTVTANDIFSFFQTAYLPIALMKDRKEVLALKTSEKFESGITSWKKKICWSLLVEELENGIVLPDEKQLKDIYEAGRQTTYLKQDPTNPNKRDPMSFSEAKPQILEEIRNSKLKSEIQRYAEKLKSEYKLKLFPEKLKPDSL